MTDQEIINDLETILDECQHLNKWEETFCQDLIQGGRALTPNQREKALQILTDKG